MTYKIHINQRSVTEHELLAGALDVQVQKIMSQDRCKGCGKVYLKQLGHECPKKGVK